MRILVTGGVGFIGSNFIRYLLNQYDKINILNLDRLTYCGNLDNLKDVEKNPNYRFIKEDICNKKIVGEIMKETEIVFHFAAESHVDNSIEAPFIFTKTNIMGTQVLLESARKSDIKKFIHISTDEVYGSIKGGSFNEESPLKPNNPYSSSKAGADLLVRGYFKTYGLPAIITRSSNNFGPHQYPEKIIPLFITNLLENKKVPVYGDGLNVRDWIYVKDNCEAIDFISKKGKIGEIYNIGGGNEISNIELTKIIIKELGKDESYIEFVKDRLGHDFRYSLNCKKIHLLGWKPKTNFKESLKRTIEWYKDNIQWWKKLKSVS